MFGVERRKKMRLEHPGFSDADVEKSLKSVTDSLKHLDALIKGEKRQLFRCVGTGLYFPPNYIEEWGRLFGIGYGPKPVSECLETNWHQKVPEFDDIKYVEQVMCPVGIAYHPIDNVIIDKNESDKGTMAVLVINDQAMVRRAGIIRNKQMNHKNGRLRALLAVNRIPVFG